MIEDMLSNTDTSIFSLEKQYSYQELVAFFDQHWGVNPGSYSVKNIQRLYALVGSPAAHIDKVLVAGTNGKSLTIQCASQLLREERLSVGQFYSSHILTYNERFLVDDGAISNKIFTEIGNKVLSAIEGIKKTYNTYEMLAVMALLYFDKQKVNVIFVEESPKNIPNVLVDLCTYDIVAITRVVGERADGDSQQCSLERINAILKAVSDGVHVVSADQNKLNLQIMQHGTEKVGGVWNMPLRKLAPLPYPFEQLHGRSAALAERISTLFLTKSVDIGADVSSEAVCKATSSESNKAGSLLSNILVKKQRGRPTLEAKRHAELNPKKTVEQFWRDFVPSTVGRFQLLDKEKPSVLLDIASNSDAIENLLLGVRLLHYRKPLEGLVVIVGFNNSDLCYENLFRQLRYFFKKNSGQLILCPVEAPLEKNGTPWNIDQVLVGLKEFKIKAKIAKTFAEAFEGAAKLVDEKNGLLVITGSKEIVANYWGYKGMKKI